MPVDQVLARTPPTTRALHTIKGARLELSRLYIQTKAGEVEPQIAGRLSHILSILIGSARDHEVEERLKAIEAQVAKIKSNGRSPEEARL